MSSHVIPPEIQAAWRIVEANRGVNFHAQYSAEFVTGREELALLMADIERFPNVDKLIAYFKRALELEIFEQESFARSLELYHSMNTCVADLEEHPEAYHFRESEEEIKRRMEEYHRGDAAFAQMAEEAQERQRDYAKNKANLAILNDMIEKRKIEQLEQIEPCGDEE